jgi:hypothetical protein
MQLAVHECGLISYKETKLGWIRDEFPDRVPPKHPLNPSDERNK